MKMYQLLRNNVESGPYTVDGLKQICLEQLDLIWIEDESITWKYPSELHELKQFAPKAALTEATIINNAKEKQIRYFKEYNIPSDYKKKNISYINEPDAFTSDIPEGYEYLVAADNANKYGGTMTIAGNAVCDAQPEVNNAELMEYNVLGEKQKVETAEIVADHQQFTTVIKVKTKTKKSPEPAKPFVENKKIIFNIAGLGMLITSRMSQLKL
ncbi:MAG: hypothetical protein IT249_11085 [Chitinophagaceae bacterium]|nr:hypothetical protein [Chitinophagaceae bacterium]